MQYAFAESAVGRLLLAGDEHGLRVLSFAGEGGATVEPDWTPDRGALARIRTEIDEYFAGVRRSFETPVRPEGTPFQQRVWAELCRIPYGETISYGELARRIGDPGAVRAVGLANGANPIAIVIPCHRVVGSNGTLVGYGGGLAIKRALLALEQGQKRLL